jgi:hypothetical protein
VSQGDAALGVGRLIAAFRKDSIPEDTAAIYVEKLQDIPGELLRATVERLIETRTFLPSIGEIRLMAAELAGLLPPSPAEAMAIIHRSDREEVRGAERGGRGYTERYWDWPEDVDPGWIGLLCDVLSRVGEPRDLSGKAYFGWDTGFQKNYEAMAEAVRREALADLSRAQLQAGGAKKVGSGDHAMRAGALGPGAEGGVEGGRAPKSR